MTVVVDQVPITLNDHTVAGDNPASQIVASCVWAQVFELGPGNQPAVSPQLNTEVVQSAEVVSVDPQTVVYQINPKAEWSDGVPITSADFVYAWQSQRGDGVDVDGSADSVASTLGYRDITSVAGTNSGRTVTVVFHTPFADWESLFDDLLPAHIAQEAGWNTGFDAFSPATLVSGGPFKVASWKPGVQIVLERNPRWWGSAPQLDEIVFDASGGAATDGQGLRTGRDDVAVESEFSASSLAEASSASTVESEVDPGMTMLQLEFNVHHGPLSSDLVREGVAHAIDRNEIATIATGQILPGLVPDGNHLFANVQQAYSNNGAAFDRADLVTGAKLLTQGGLIPNAEGTWTSHGNPVSLNLVWASGDPWSASVGPSIAAELVNAGFNVYADPVPKTELVGSVLPQGAFDLALVPLTASIFPTSMAEAFSTSLSVGASGLGPDWSGFDDPKIDAMFTQAAGDLNAASAASTYQQIDQDLWAEMPSLPLFAEPMLLAYSTSVSGVLDDPGGPTPMWGATQWARLVASHVKGKTG